MKNLLKKAVIFAVAGIMALSVEAQEEKGVQFTVSGDFVSSYVWRGIYQGAQACVQPTLGLGLGGFSLTAWGSTSLADVEAGHKELDLTAAYSVGDLPFRLPIFGGEDKEITVISIMGIRIQTIILKQVYLMFYLVKSFL